MALRLCVERLLPVCRERAVKFKLPPIESPADIAAAMKAVTAALADRACGQPRRPTGNKQPEQREPGFLSKRAEGRDCMFFIHAMRFQSFNDRLNYSLGLTLVK